MSDDGPLVVNASELSGLIDKLRPAGSVLAAFDASVTAAGDRLSKVDGAAIAAARSLARKIDAMEDEPAAVSEDGELREERRRSLDNVTMPTFLKYLDALGLTPGGRRLLEQNNTGRPSGKLHAIRSAAAAATAAS
jgi:hypothetical protein